MRPSRGHVLVAALAAAGACTIAPAPPGVGTSGGLDLDIPPGYGTLRQEDVSMVITSGDLQLMVTPLDASVTHVTAPDTERRLSGLANAHATDPSTNGQGLFLVSFFSQEPDVVFVPEEVQFISRGLRVRPRTITPVTPSWGEQRVGQRQTEMAVYSFGDGVDLESTLTLAYRFDQSNQWTAILPRIQSERARARARSGAELRD
ncbi:MAG: hypothetical protein OEO79_01880 [Gemmatimonadota bacterium]|nr:hypothetical protein [Gemmatimonadota bacterium]